MRREKLLTAAETLFARDGYWVPLERIAEAADVGRGTLYRNFSDRLALALAIFDRATDRVAERLSDDLPLEEALSAMIRHAAAPTALFQRLAADLPLEGETRAAFGRLRTKIIELLEPLAERARREGSLHPDYGAEELLLATRMAAALQLPHLSAADREQQMRQSIHLLLRGLRPPAR